MEDSAPIATVSLAALSDLVLDVGRLLRAYSGASDPRLPMTESERLIVRFLDRYPGASPSEISRRLRMRRPNVSACLGSLEAKGAISRTSVGGRDVSVTATRLAAATLARHRQHWNETLSEIIGASLNQDDLDACTHALAILERRLTVGVSFSENPSSDSP